MTYWLLCLAWLFLMFAAWCLFKVGGDADDN
jgi:hypothetical protein